MNIKAQKLTGAFRLDEKDGTRMVYCLSATFLFGLVAHAYVFLNSVFSHDSLGVIYATVYEDNWKIALGRFFVPLYRTIVRGKISFPWLIGLLALLWIGLSAFLIAQIFKLKSKLNIFLLSGVLVANLTVTSLAATFVHELDVDMFALFAATLAAFMWHKWTWGIWPGMLLCAVALGIYQSYISVTIVIIMMESMWRLLEGDSTAQVFLKGIKSICMLLGGGVLYLVLLKFSCAYSGTALVDNYNGLLSVTELSFVDIGRLIVEAYKDWIEVFLQPKAAYWGSIVRHTNITTVFLLSILVVMIVTKKTLSVGTKGLFLLLVALLPLGMNVSFVLSGGMVHDLMRYAFWLLHFLVILLACWICPAEEKNGHIKRIIKGLTVVVTIFIVWNNILVSNALYLKKDLEYQSTISQMTRVADRLEDMTDYVAGDTPVVFVSRSYQSAMMPGFEKVAEIAGAELNTAITYNTLVMYDTYFRYILNTPILLDGAAWSSFQTDERVIEMPAFPSEGSVKEIDGIVVVKMGD